MQELLKQLDVLTQMMREYAERNKIKNGITITIEDDCSGSIFEFPEIYPDNKIFKFNSLPELIDKLKQ